MGALELPSSIWINPNICNEETHGVWSRHQGEHVVYGYPKERMY